MIVFSLYPRNWGLNITLALSFSQNSKSSGVAACGYGLDNRDDSDSSTNGLNGRSSIVKLRLYFLHKRADEFGFVA